MPSAQKAIGASSLRSDVPRKQLRGSAWSRALPRGRRLPDEVWVQRHRGLVALLWLHVPLLFLFGLYRGHSVYYVLVWCSPLAVFAGVALVPRLSRAVRCASVALGLVGACSVLVDLSGGAIEAHFHYFVVIAFLTLYQEWLPYLIAIVFVLFEHGIVGIISPGSVYHHAGMAGMGQDPWRWALIHAGFVLAASFANLLAWRLTEHEALYDALTGLPNRLLFLESVRSAQDTQGRPTGVLVIDLDNFKAVNDGFGHDNGDGLLRAIAARLTWAARTDDVVARIGGDEFGVILHDVSNDDEAVAIAARYLSKFEDPFTANGMSMLASASIGLAVSGGRSVTAADLLRNADLAMYDAKRAGGGQASVYRADMHDLALARANLESELRGALSRSELRVFYQPLVSLSTGQVVGTEALVRWQHPTRGLVPPLDFIPMAEQSGLVVALGEWVLRTACRQTAAWHRAHPDRRPITVSVNLSPRQLADRHIVEVVVNALHESDLAPGYLCLEVTENAFIKDFDGALRKLRVLHSMGISLALDDFGTGYSSLSYLRQLPADSVKIDRSFITDLVTGDNRIVVAIIDLAHALGLSVTAEGVETADQFELLGAMSADVAQGYLLDRPLPGEQMTRRLNEQDPGGRWGSPATRADSTRPLGARTDRRP